MKVSKENARDIVCDCHDEWEEIQNKVSSQRRWVTFYKYVGKHIPTGKFYEVYYDLGSTEMQDQKAFEYDEPVFTEVEKKEVVVTKYVPVK